MGQVKGALTLRSDAPAGAVDRALAWLRAAGVEVGGVGRVTISFVADADDVSRLFGSTVRRVEAVPPGPVDFGAPEGFVEDDDPVVPEELADIVASVSVEPPAIRFGP
ncbi:MAG: hypothetical protein ACFCGT_06175 [Sandaracinaceae bacterium]